MSTSVLLLKIRQLAAGSSMRRNIGMTLGRQVAAAAMHLLVVVIIARELGPEGNGFYALAVLVPTLLANILNLGIGPATVYYLSRRDFTTHQVVKGNVRLALIIGCVGVGATIPILMLWGGVLFQNIPQDMLFLAVLCLPIMLLLAFLNAVLQGLEDFRAFNASVLLPPFIMLIGTTIVLYFLESGVYGVLIVFIMGQMAALVAVSLFLRGHLARDAQMAIAKTDASGYNQKVLGFGWKAHLSNVITFVNYRADIFLVNFFLSPAAAGIYVIAMQISEKLWMPSQAVSTVLYPRLSAMKDQPVGRLKLAQKGFTLVALITAILSGAFAIALYFFIGPIFGDDYRAAFPAFLWLIPGVVLWAGARIQANCIAASGKPEWNMYVSLVVLTINILGNMILIPIYGIAGAAIATSLAYVVDAIMKFYLVGKTANI